MSLSSAIQRAQVSLDKVASRVVTAVEVKASGRTLPPSIRAKIAAALTPLMHAEAAASYKRSGLGIESGEMFAAAVQQSEVVINNNSIVLLLPRGKPKQFYARAGALQYGAVRNANGAKLGKVVKKALVKSGQTTKPYHFFEFDATQKARIKIKFEELKAYYMGVA